jgi:hypothetical protein
MSLDFYLEEVKPVDVYSASITHNLSRMAREAGVYDALWASEKFQTAAELIPILRAGIAAMEDQPERFKPLSASNGWGTYDQFLPWVRAVLSACIENSSAKPRSSC